MTQAVAHLLAEIEQLSPPERGEVWQVDFGLTQKVPSGIGHQREASFMIVGRALRLPFGKRPGVAGGAPALQAKG